MARKQPPEPEPQKKPIGRPPKPEHLKSRKVSTSFKFAHENYMKALEELALRERRPLVRQLELALEEYLAAKGLWPWKDSMQTKPVWQQEE